MQLFAQTRHYTRCIGLGSWCEGDSILFQSKYFHYKTSNKLLVCQKRLLNTPGTRFVFLHISSIYAKILGETNFQPRDFPEVGQRQKTEKKEEREKDWMMVITMASYALQTPYSSSYAKIWWKQIFSHGSFPEVGQKQKTERKKEEREKKRRDRTMVITMAKLRMAHASTLATRKPYLPILQ